MDESVVPITTIKKTDLLYGYTSIHLPSFPSSIHIDFIPESSEYVGNLFPSGHLTGKWLKQTPIAGYHWHGFARVKSTLEIGNWHLWEGTHHNFSGMPSDEVSPFTRELPRFCSQYTTTWQYPHFVFFPLCPTDAHWSIFEYYTSRHTMNAAYICWVNLSKVSINGSCILVSETCT